MIKDVTEKKDKLQESLNTPQARESIRQVLITRKAVQRLVEIARSSKKEEKMGMTTDELYFKPSLRVINEGQIRQIHAATLEVLERTGIRMPHARGLELLDGAGARVDGNRGNVYSRGPPLGKGHAGSHGISFDLIYPKKRAWDWEHLLSGQWNRICMISEKIWSP